jgi:ribose transport system permease protein
MSVVRRSRWNHLSVQQAPLLLAFIMLAITVAAYVAFFDLRLHHLPTGFAWDSTISNALPLVFVSVGQGIVVLTRSLDLSVGGIMDLTNSLAATHMHSSVASMLFWSLAVLAVGGVIGLVNGLLVTVGRLQPIVVTVATMSILQGVAAWVLPQPGGNIPASYTNTLANSNNPSGLAFIAGVAAFWLLIRRLRLGVALYAVGNDAEAANALGINVRLVRTLAFVLSGVMAAAAGLFLAAGSSGGDATGGDSYLLASFAAVVLGGISFFGGRGSIIGIVCGAGVLTLLVSVLFYANVNSFYESFYEGIFLVVAVVLGMLVTRLAQRRARGRQGKLRGGSSFYGG